MATEGKKIQRREVLQRLEKALHADDLVIAALAGTTVDCFETMHRPGNLYLVGMGMVTPVGFGLATALPNRRVIALDTDGSLLLSPSILGVVGVYKPRNFRILVFDNERLYGSRGGPPSQTAHGADLAGMARAAGIEQADSLEGAGILDSKISWFLSARGPVILVVKVDPSYLRGTGPSMSGQENKFQFVRHIEATERITILGA